MIDSISVASTPLLITTVLVIVCFAFLKSLLTGQPGPWGLPVLGYYPFLEAKFHLHLARLAKKYGDVFVFNFAGQEYVHLNSLEAIKEALVTKADCFAKRCHKYGTVEILFQNGAGFVDGERWRVLRKFLVQGLRHYGIGGSSGEFRGPVLDSVKTTIEELQKKNGQVVDTMQILTRACTCSVRRMFFGDLVDEEYGILVSRAYEQTAQGFIGTNILLAGNFAKYFIFPFRKELRNMTKDKKILNDKLQKIVDDHKPTLDPENPRDFIDLYLIEKKSRKDKNDPQAVYFTDESLVGTLVQAFGDGSIGVAFFIATFLRELSFVPEIQERIYEEIADVVGTERLPTWEDRSDLPYTMATLKELVRTSTFFPITPSLECTKDTTIQGVPVSKGQLTLVNMHSVHYSPNNFKEPQRFDPERFLNDENLPIVAFGLGKRACTGATMVMQMTFVFLAAICQCFKLSTEEDISSKTTLTSMDEIGLCKVRFDLRKPFDAKAG